MVTSDAPSVPLTASGNVVLAAVNGGIVGTLVISSAERDLDFPTVPTTVDPGHPEVISRNGLSVPPKMSNQISQAWDALL